MEGEHDGAKGKGKKRKAEQQGGTSVTTEAEGGTSATTDNAFLKYAASMASSMATMAETNKMLVQQAQAQVQQEVQSPRVKQGGIPLASR